MAREQCKNPYGIQERLFAYGKKSNLEGSLNSGRLIEIRKEMSLVLAREGFPHGWNPTLC